MIIASFEELSHVIFRTLFIAYRWWLLLLYDSATYANLYKNIMILKVLDYFFRKEIEY